MVNTSRIESLLKKYYDGSITHPEYVELIRELQASDNDTSFLKSMDTIWADAKPESFYTSQEEEAFYQKLIGSGQFRKKSRRIQLRPFYRYMAAAVAVFILSAGLYFYFIRQNQAVASRFAANDILPGGNKAMLILSNGKKINLGDAANGQLLSESGIAVSKTADGQIRYTVKESTGKAGTPLENTIVTPKGGQYQVVLPDGSKVWLNAASTLKFPLRFSNNERSVQLSGEAYFEVAKKTLRTGGKLPFYVSTAKLRVEVLGTHFNVNAYESTSKTTLLEGAVRLIAAAVAPSLKAQVSYLSPGQQGIAGASGITVSTADIEETMAWKNGLFMFNNQNLDVIMKEVERWYDVDVVFADDELRKASFNGAVSRFKNISQLLEVLESTGSVHFKVEGRRITVMD